jgi:hypothetical protein
MAGFLPRSWLRCALLLLGAVCPCLQAAHPIQLNPENNRYFLWRGKPEVLLTSAEHYGAVLNLDFDYKKYLETLEKDGLNCTRLFTGAYVEPVGAFGIAHNTLAPAPGRYLAPWVRSGDAGYPGGGAKFDLEKFSPEYLARLKDFMAEASRRGVVVELTLFCSTYSANQWALHPFNPTNNINQFPVPDWKLLNISTNGKVFEYQDALVRYLVKELNVYDNLIYEIQNEPWADHHEMGEILNPYLTDKRSFPNAVEITTTNSVAWQRAIARMITQTESKLPVKHLISQNIANFRLALRPEDIVSDAGILNFHYAYPEAATWNVGLGKAIGCNETGFAGSSDTVYRQQAWELFLSGASVFNHLDYSFSVGHEDGLDTENKAPGGGSADFRKSLKVLGSFLRSFDLPHMKPDLESVKNAPGVSTRTLSDGQNLFAIYCRGRGPTSLLIELPQGSWKADWIDPVKGDVLASERFTHRHGLRPLPSPNFQNEIALRLGRK